MMLADFTDTLAQTRQQTILLFFAIVLTLIFQILFGNLAEEGAVAKITGKEGELFTGPAKVFEDEFFADLKKRNLTMEGKVGQWQQGIDSRMQEIESSQVAERLTLEKRYSEELKTVLGQANRSSSDELSRLSRRVEEFEVQIEDRLNISETSIGTFGSGLEESLLQIRQDSDELFQKELR